MRILAIGILVSALFCGGCKKEEEKGAAGEGDTKEATEESPPQAAKPAADPNNVLAPMSKSSFDSMFQDLANADFVADDPVEKYTLALGAYCQQAKLDEAGCTARAEEFRTAYRRVVGTLEKAVKEFCAEKELAEQECLTQLGSFKHELPVNYYMRDVTTQMKRNPPKPAEGEGEGDEATDE